jgi:hypothetical protein
MLVRYVVGIDRDHVGDFTGSWVTLADSRGSVFAVDIIGERSFSFRSFTRAAASGSFEAAVADDPDRTLDDLSVLVPSSWLKPEASAFASTRHFVLICWIAWSVV